MSNALVWTLYPRTYLVTSTSPDNVEGSLRRALIDAANDPSGRALITFSRDAFPGAGAQQTIALDDKRCALPSDDPALCCEPDSHHAALCFRGSGVVVDGLDGDAEPGGVVLSAANGIALLRIYGRDNIFRGLVFHGSQADISANPCADDEDSATGSSVSAQVDTVAITGAEAQGNSIEQSVVVGPTCGDAVNVDTGASDNFILASRITGAQDRGVKANNGAVTIARSCVHDNIKGGIQSTLEADVTALENVVQHNAGGEGQNGRPSLTPARTPAASTPGEANWRRRETSSASRAAEGSRYATTRTRASKATTSPTVA